MTIEELKQEKRWTLWRFDTGKDEKPTKVPYQPNGYRASIRNPEHLHTYTELEPHAADFSGIGLALGTIEGCSVWGVDIDACCDGGTFSHEALEVITGLGTYAEYSPSGTGCHIWGLGTLPGQGLQKPYPGCKQIEVKADGYYQTFTGCHIPDTPVGLENRQAEITALYERVAQINRPKTEGLVVSLPVSSEEKLNRLMSGDMSDYDDDHSRADLAACTLLAMKYGANPFKVEEEFNKSKLAREKWFDRDDYRHGTITKGIITAIQNGAAETAEVTLSDEPKDWRTHYHTFEEMQNAPPAAFLIENFLQQDAITALAAPVAQRKSLIALNVAWALCTGEPLFDYFKVIQQPTRVLYLCPEMGIRSFTDRLRKIKLMDHIGKTLFCRTMSAEGTLELSALTAEELNGGVVIIDTAVRYLRGDENSSEHMRAFAEEVFRIMRDGAVSVLLLHHSLKGTKESPDLSLENAMRGSGELGAFIASCWATRLQDPGSPYESASYLANVKQRDFESKPFEVTSGPDCRLHIVGEPGDHVTLNSKPAGAQADKDGKEAMALALMRAHPELSNAKMAQFLKNNGIQRSRTWVGEKRYELLQNGGVMGTPTTAL